MIQGIYSRRIVDSPVAVIDFETTGLSPGYDRVVEVSVVRIDPGQEPRIAFDTLVNPQRPMAATEIHGIRDEDVREAPRFHEVVGDLVDAVQGCVIAAYNVYFDIKFLDFELRASGVSHKAPHFCLMYLRPALGLGARCRLDAACQFHRIDYSASHVAADDALAAAYLYRLYLSELQSRSVETFGDLAQRKSYKFFDSFACEPFPKAEYFGLKSSNRIRSRSEFATQPDPERAAVAAYWDTLKTVLADLDISDDELAFVEAERNRGGLPTERIRVLHARAFASVMSQFTSDQWLDDREARKLRKLHQCLAKLGWAPGM